MSSTDRRVHAGRLVPLALICLGLATATRIADGQANPRPPPTLARPPALEQAKDEFRRGVALLNAGDTEGALSDFQRSRELVPSGKNTVDAAICLERLGRYDEALELYEKVVERFAADLDEEDRQNLAPVMRSLEAKLAYFQLSANVDGEVIVSGRVRGRLPLATVLRVLPGRRVIRIFKDGYRPFEIALDFSAGQTKEFAARLEPVNARAALAATNSSTARASDRGKRRTLAWTVSIASAAELGLAAYFGARAFELHSHNNDAAARSVADASTVLTITGLASAAAGLYLFMTSNRRSAAPAPKPISIGFGRDEILVFGCF